MSDKINPDPNLPANNDAGDAAIKFCKICGEELTETNRSKEKTDVCLDCEGRGAETTEDHTQKNANQDGVDSAGSL